MPSSKDKSSDNWNTGKGSTWDNVWRGAKQGAKEFAQNPVKEISRAQDDFNNAGSLTDSLTGSSDSNGGNNGNNNGGKGKK